MDVVGGRDLIAACQLQIVCDEVARLEVQSQSIACFTAQPRRYFSDQSQGIIGENES